MNEKYVNTLSERLYQAEVSGSTVEPLTGDEPSITIDDAYLVSIRTLEKRVKNGERVVGKKIGLTSKVVQEMLGVHQPDFGFLTDAMSYASDSTIDLNKTLIQPKAEGEIAFFLNKALVGPGVTDKDVLDATEGVAACFEIVDSRIKDWKIKIQDTIADNASCGLFVVSNEMVDPKLIDFVNCKMVLEKNGEIAAEGEGSAALGSPLNCVAWLANTLGEYGISLDPGDVILSGSLASMLPVDRGDSFKVSIEGVGSCSINFS